MPLTVVPLFHMLALRFGKRVWSVESIIELNIHMVDLKPKHGTQRRNVGRKTAVSRMDVFTIRNGGANGCLAGSGGGGDGGWIEPSAVNYPAPENPLRAYLPLDDVADGGF